MKTLFILTAAVAFAQDGGLPYPPQMQGAKVETYATVANTKLNLYIFDPPQKSTPRPAPPSSSSSAEAGPMAAPSNSNSTAAA